MIVAHVVRQYAPSVGGLEEVVKNLAKCQLEAGLTPYIITLDRVFKNPEEKLAAIEWMDGVKVIRIPYGGSSRYPLAFSVLRHLKEADLVHVHAIDFFYDFLALTKIIHGKKLVVSTHGGFFHTTYASRLKKIYFKTVTRFCSLFYDKVIGCSDNDGEIFSQIIPPEKLVVIENGVDIDKLSAPASELPPKPNIIYFGRWSINKGLVEALRLFSTLVKSDRGNHWQFVIAGRPYDIDEDEIRKTATEYGINDRVQVYASPSDSQLKQLAHAASYFLCLSKHEGFGIAPIEAMSAGLFPLLSQIPPFKKLATTTGHGALLSEDSVAAADSVMRLHQEKNWNQFALQESVKRYSWHAVGTQYLNEYRRILNDG
ncbi:alpha-1,3-mannosyltransferase [Methylophilus rhizosphaerae]|uniref:Alpha-1,3-mannosyltransferase n=1 Tax=Methylophilus rhizosphaerae TaxID=492660 RepID=A0A1G8Z108_9PROT|nr:glycosyltransferase family 4 protein [Methylophilus rhizosphaerae]SDK08703.1 alpha-1,3-mannosyltransferase [Methylophilus rhizosphaerae]